MQLNSIGFKLKDGANVLVNLASDSRIKNTLTRCRLIQLDRFHSLAFVRKKKRLTISPRHIL